VTLTNHLSTPLTVSPAVATGDFAVASNTCGASVGPGRSCTVGVTFTPKVVGVRTGTLTLPYRAFGSPSVVALSGAGNANGLISITVTPANPSIILGQTQQCTATGHFRGGSTQNLTASVAWGSSASGVATINAAGLASSVSAGSTTIVATWVTITPLGRATGVTPGTPIINPPPISSISGSTTLTVTAQTWSISGTVSPPSSGSGTLVTLSGSSSATVTADSSGNYSFAGLANGTYTVTPSMAGFTFSPTAQAVTINGSNATGVNFTATAIAQNGCGDTLTSASPTCQVIGSGHVNPAWTVISRHGEYAQDEDECNIPSSWTQTAGTLTTTTSNTSYTCGDFYTNGTVRDAATSWPYTTGDIQWGSLSFKYGTITVRFKLPSSATDLWPAIWMLATNCQTTNIYSGDTGFDGCPNLGSSGYQEADLVECDVDRWCGYTGYNPGSVCSGTFSVDDTNYHILVTTWTSSGFSQTLDGSSIGTCSTGSFANPMFLILQTQAGGIGNPVNNQLPATFAFSYVQVKNSSGTIIFSDDFSSDIYFAQSSAGTGMGSDCADARAISSMLAMDWSPGNNLYLCGTYTTQPVALGSGTSGSPITVTYESGASGPCPNLNGYTYITVVGGGCSASSSVAPSATMLLSGGEGPVTEAPQPLAARLTNK
jgi:hypothetical protein